MRKPPLIAATVAVAGLLAAAPAAPAPRLTAHRETAGTSAAADDSSPASHPAPSEAKAGPDGAPAALAGEVENAAVTQHEATIGGQRLKYRATAANMPMKDEAGKLKATVFFVAYEKIGAVETAPAEIKPVETQPAEMQPAETVPAEAGGAPRPITFVFNGGPGAAAVWLHLGAAGPRRIALREHGEPPPPPHRLLDNPHSWLDATDLVFIDPVGTGFSRPAEGEKREEFYGVREDITWVAEFIRLYVTRYQRWLSPMFLAGESYGTTRAAGLAQYLLDRYGIALNGIILVSCVLDFQTLSPRGFNDLPFPLYLPTYAAIAWYHKKLPDDLATLLAEVERWAMGPYAAALAQGQALDAGQRQAVVRTLARYTALPPEFVERSNLRIKPGAFQKQLLLGERKLIGRFDARITGADPDPTAALPAYDPSLSPYFAAYSATFNDYVRRTLRYESVLPYEVLSEKVHPWNYGEAGRGYLSVADDLHLAMIKNPHLKVLFASGYFDLATPYFATNYTIEHLDLDRELRANIVHTFYTGGHMMYHNPPSREKLKTDVAAFIRSALPD